MVNRSGSWTVAREGEAGRRLTRGANSSELKLTAGTLNELNSKNGD